MEYRIADFEELIRRHDAYDFGPWRRLFSRHADDLAGFCKTIPEAAPFTRDAIRAAFAAGARFSGDPQRVFQPWDGWWSGVWSNGATQYHIWDVTVPHGGQYVQPVTQSETNFADASHLAAMRTAGQVNLAINVCGTSKGITGWVIKGQGHYPHVAYQLNAHTLIWITEYDRRFLMFYEWAEPTRGQTTGYKIRGRPFSIAGNQFQPSNELHYGDYTRHPNHR